MDPINYSAGMPQSQDFLKDIVGGLQAGNAIQDSQLKRDTAQRAIDLQNQYSTDIHTYLQNPTAQGAAAIALKYPTQAAAVKSGWDTLDEADRRDQGDTMSQGYAALLAGRPDIAQDVLAKRIKAKKNSNIDTSAEENVLKILQENPTQAKAALGLVLSHVTDPKTFAATYGSLGAEGRAADEAPADLAKKNADAAIQATAAGVAPSKAAQDVAKGDAEIANINSQIAERGARLGLDRDTLTTNTQLKLTELNNKFGQIPEDVRKDVNGAATQSVASDQVANQARSLADRIDAQALRGGLVGRGAELVKSITGNEDTITGLRQEYTRLRNQGVMKLLPPGSASDKDVAFATKGFPTDTANPAQMSSFLRGMSKISNYDSLLNDAKSQWLTVNQHLGRAKNDMTIDGVQIPAGTTFNDFARQSVAKRAATISGTQLVDSLAKKYGQPGQ